MNRIRGAPDNDKLKPFVKPSDTRHVALLSAEEENTLALAIAEGDADARERMIRANLGLVIKIARDYSERGLSRDDLIGEGNLGLIRAVQRFDPRFGVRFGTYAGYWIKQAILHALMNTAGTIRLPAHMVRLLSRWRRTERTLTRASGCAPTFYQIACDLGLSPSQHSLVRKAQHTRQLQCKGSETQDEWHSSLDNWEDHRDSNEGHIEVQEELELLSRQLDRLEPRERTIIVLRHGLEGETPLTLKRIGQRLGMTREWVRRIELRALHKLSASAYSSSPLPAHTSLPAAFGQASLAGSYMGNSLAFQCGQC